MKRLLTHLSVQAILYCILYHVYNFFYLSLHLISYWWGGLFFAVFNWFIWRNIIKTIAALEEKNGWSEWKAMLMMAIVGSSVAFVTLILHNGFFHMLNKFPWYYPEAMAEAKLAFGIGFPSVIIGELIWRKDHRMGMIIKSTLSLILVISYMLNNTRIWKVEKSELFKGQETAGQIKERKINEASGLAASRINKGILYTHNDAGDKSHLFMIDDKANFIGTLRLGGAKLRDLEDLAIGPGPEEGVNYLYVGDIGNNQKYLNGMTVYRLPEPDLSQFSLSEEKGIYEIDISAYDVIRFTYPDGRRDAETLLIDPLTRDLWVVSKREVHVHTYKASYPQTTGKEFELEKMGNLDVFNIVAGDISPDGKEILLKSYEQIFYWKRDSAQSLQESFLSTPVSLSYIPEPQGEAISWSSDGDMFYTLSEKMGRQMPRLYYYTRNW